MKEYRANRTSEMTQSELDHQKRVRELAGECMVILENDGVLPLKETGKVALYGNGARHTIKGGTGSGDVNARNVVTMNRSEKKKQHTRKKSKRLLPNCISRRSM